MTARDVPHGENKMVSYFEYPNLPDRKAKRVVLDYRADYDTVKSLEKAGVGILPTVPLPSVLRPVDGHPDMALCHAGGNRFVAAPEVHGYYAEQLTPADVKRGEKYLSPEYPKDIAYNCAVIGKYLVCGEKDTSSVLLDANSGKTVINVRQGYAKCSICIVNENALITADKGIAERCADAGFDVLKIAPGHVELPGMDCGFIGGAAGLLAPGILAVNGELKEHPCGDDIKSFCRMHGTDIYELKKGQIKDIGTIMPVS